MYLFIQKSTQVNNLKNSQLVLNEVVSRATVLELQVVKKSKIKKLKLDKNSLDFLFSLKCDLQKKLETCKDRFEWELKQASASNDQKIKMFKDKEVKKIL